MSEIMARNSLTDTQKRVAEIFATNDIQKKTIAQIAEEFGIAERTIYRWKKDPQFIAYQNAVADNAMEDFLNEAYLTLKKLLRDGKSEKTQLEAIKLVLQNRGKLKEKQELSVEVKQAQTLDDLEKEIIDMERDLLE